MIKIAIEELTKPITKSQSTMGEFSSSLGKITVDLKALSVAMDHQAIDLETIPGTKGGQRFFFCCPGCGKRCRLLYHSKGKVPACGACYKVHHRTLNRTKTDCQYYWTRAINEMRKIDPKAEPKRGYVDYDDFPTKPRWMKWTKYWRHYRRFIKYLDKGVDLWLKSARI